MFFPMFPLLLFVIPSYLNRCFYNVSFVPVLLCLLCSKRCRIKVVRRAKVSDIGHERDAAVGQVQRLTGASHVYLLSVRGGSLYDKQSENCKHPVSAVGQDRTDYIRRPENVRCRSLCNSAMFPNLVKVCNGEHFYALLFSLYIFSFVLVSMQPGTS